jgi:hypothetical protein
MTLFVAVHQHAPERCPPVKGYFPLMGESDARVRAIRTTGDGAGRGFGIVTGMAATPDEALAELRRNAEAQAESLDDRTPGEQRADRLRELDEPFESAFLAIRGCRCPPDGRRHRRGRQRLAGLRDFGQVIREHHRPRARTACACHCAAALNVRAGTRLRDDGARCSSSQACQCTPVI